MEKRLQGKARWVLAGWILFLALVFLHPLFLETFGKEHPPDCPLCVHYTSASAIILSIFVLPFFVFLAYFLFSVFRPLTSVVFVVSPGRAPPTLL